MHSLNDTPIFLEFLKRFFKFVKIEFSNKYIQNKLFIYSKCNCKDKGCATVYLKSRTPWKESIQGIYFFDTNKGMFIIHVEENGFLEFEALLYEQYPYKKEIDTFYRFKGKSFLLGICRGNQLLTILSGGKLIQHVEGHCRDHSMVLNNGLKYNITSSHHQMLYPFDLNEKDYELVAYSEYFQSNTYLNGVNEEIELPKNFLEPEIVYYKNTNALCIQGHPEWSHCEKRTSTMCLNLIDKYLKEFKKSKEGNNSQILSRYVKGSWDDSPYNDDNNHYEEDHQDYNWVEEEEHEEI